MSFAIFFVKSGNKYVTFIFVCVCVLGRIKKLVSVATYRGWNKRE
jgi:hypothetical protein